MLKIGRVLIVLLALTVAASAWGIDIQNLWPAPGADNLAGLYTSTPLDHGQFSVAYLFNYAANPLEITFQDDEDVQVVHRMMAHQMSAAVGLFGRVTVGVGGTYNFLFGDGLGTDRAIEGLSPDDPSDEKINEGAVGDLHAAVKVAILANRPGSVGLALVPIASFPTGDAELYSGADAIDAGLMIVLDKRLGIVNLVANGGFLYKGKTDDLDPDAEARGGLGVVVSPWRFIDGFLEIQGARTDYHIEGIDAAFPVEGRAGVKFYTGVGIDFLAAAGMGFTSGIGSPSMRALLGVSFAYPRLDRGWETAPRPAPEETDRDGDRLTDAEEEKYGTNPRRKDTDRDELTDGEEVLDFGTDPNSADTDGDGIEDGREALGLGTDPALADTDGDGIEDNREITETGTDPRNADSDNDGVPDGVDGSPLEAENVNGFQDEDGIPEITLSETESGVTLFDTGLFVPEPVTFAEGSHKDITKGSLPMLRDILILMQQYTDLKILIVGHTDEKEEAAFKDKNLSLTRAQTVQSFFLRSGIASDRIQVSGVADLFPLDTSGTQEGMRKNRRVEFRQAY